MKELRNKTDGTKELSLYEQAMQSKPRFASGEEAIAFYTRELETLAKGRGVTVTTLLNEAEYSSEIDNDDYIEARALWCHLSTAKALHEKYKK